MNELLEKWKEYKIQLSKYQYRNEEENPTRHWLGNSCFTKDFEGFMKWIELGEPEAIKS